MSDLTKEPIKNPLGSRTVRWALLGILTLVAKFAGADVDKTSLSALLAYISDNWEIATAFVTFIMTIIYRIKAERPIKWEPKVPKGISLWLLIIVFIVCWGTLLSTHAGEGKSIVVDEAPVVDTDPTGFYVEGFSAGLFPTNSNQPEPLDISGNFTVGGGAGIGYRFNDVLSLSITGKIVRADGIWIEDYFATLRAYLPSETDTGMFLPDFIKIPDFANSELYIFVGGGAHRFDQNWDSLIRAGIGVEMPITPRLPGSFYFLEGSYDVIGIGSSSSALDPVVSVHTGVRLKF